MPCRAIWKSTYLVTNMTHGSAAEISFFLLILIGRALSDQASFNPCLVHPSEYSYHKNSVLRAESAMANCRNYPIGEDSNIYSENYIYCNGSQLELADCIIPETYGSSKYYVWPAGLSSSQLLFVFPSRINMTTITLHYYSDDDKGLPMLKFLMVPDKFNIWDGPTATTHNAEVAAVSPGGESEGHKNVTINFSVNTMKILLLKLGSPFKFAVSELEFFKCDSSSSTPAKFNTKPNIYISTISNPQKVSTYSASVTATSKVTATFSSLITTKHYNKTNNSSTMMLTALATVIVLVLIFTTVITALAFYFRKPVQQKMSTHLTLCRGTTEQLQSQQHHSLNDFYDQIQLSPLTGQAEVMPEAETENKNSGSQNTRNNDAKEHKPDLLQPILSSLKPPDVDKSTDEQTSHAISNKKQKMDKLNKRKENVVAGNQKESVQTKKHAIGKVEELYTVVQKIPKSTVAKGEDEAPPTPPHTVEELYTAVVKKPKCSTAEDSPPVPPHTIEALYTAVEKISKDGALQSEEEAPPIPSHTVEELYTAVQKKTK